MSTTVKPFDIVRCIHYKSGALAGLLGEVRELMGDSAYVEFNDEAGEVFEGQILSLSWLEFVYRPTGWHTLVTAEQLDNFLVNGVRP